MRVQGAGGPHQHRRLRQVAAALLAAAAPIRADAADPADAATQQPVPDPNREIVVIAPPLFHDIQPERQLAPEDIESYGVSTIDELLGEIQTELGDEADEPLILVNGKRVNDLADIGAFPVEVLRNIQILPRGSAVALGGQTGQRVVNLTLKREAKNATLTAAHKIATEGDWSADRGEAILTRIRGSTRANLTLRARDEGSILESDRDIIQPAPRFAYAQSGNLVSYPGTISEIDPLLSALAGKIVTVAPIPGGANPLLGDFAPQANQPSVTDLGQFRTLRPGSRNYDLNATFATPLASWLTANATLRLNQSTRPSIRGLPAAVFVVSADNVFSPFSNDVGLAFYGTRPLASESRSRGGQASLTLNAVFGAWTVDWTSNHQLTNNVTRSERQSSPTTVHIDDNVNPFATDLPGLFTIRTDRFSSRSGTTLSQMTANGPLAKLPAGQVQATVEGRAAWNRVHSNSKFAGIDSPRDFHRSEQSIRGAIDIPIASRAAGFLAALGELDANIEYGRTHYSDAGSASHYGYELNWEPRPFLRLSGAIEGTDVPAPVELIGGPVTVIPDVRTYDPLTGETVDVTQITGGNPDLLPQKTKIRRVNALVRLVPQLKLQLNAEYTDTDRRNFVSSLPEASAAVTLAFPDRFVRDSSGMLTIVDLRPVNFESDREKRLRWGFSMSAKLGGGSPAPTAPGAKGHPTRRPATTFQVTANHTIVFSDEIVIRKGLEPVDLLGGGAIGIASGRTRHQVDGTASITSGGTGVRIGATWRGPSSLESRIDGVTDTLRFSPLLLINLRAFTEVKRFVAHSEWAKGLRLSLDVLNLTNDRQSVRDSTGNTPLRYQPGYRDPLGRTIEIELRKVF